MEKITIRIPKEFTDYFGAAVTSIIRGKTVSVPCDGQEHNVPSEHAKDILSRVANLKKIITKNEKDETIVSGVNTSGGSGNTPVAYGICKLTRVQGFDDDIWTCESTKEELEKFVDGTYVNGVAEIISMSDSGITKSYGRFLGTGEIPGFEGDVILFSFGVPYFDFDAGNLDYDMIAVKYNWQVGCEEVRYFGNECVTHIYDGRPN